MLAFLNVLYAFAAAWRRRSVLRVLEIFAFSACPRVSKIFLRAFLLAEKCFSLSECSKKIFWLLCGRFFVSKKFFVRVVSTWLFEMFGRALAAFALWPCAWKLR